MNYSKAVKKILLSMSLLFLSCLNLTHASTVTGLRLWMAPDNTRVVLDLNGKAQYKKFTLKNPNRLVIDIEEAKLLNDEIIKDVDWDDTEVARLRYSSNKKYLRFVFDLKKPINYKVFDLEPNNVISNYRIVLDIYSQDQNKSNQVVNLPVIIDKSASGTIRRFSKFNVVIDPGHGGDDPGSIGGSGTREKDVVLSISKYLKEYIDQDKDMRAILTRTGDYYIGLKQRTEKARDNQADLFVSIHADGFRDSRAKGASVFVLSERGASSELAKWIAEHENASDLVGGVSLDNKDPMLATVLLDLSQTASNHSSYRVANKVLKEISKVTYMHKPGVEKAGFVVLKSPDIPSILVETGFITNPVGERNLRSESYQRKIAHTIYTGIKTYFKTEPRPNRQDFDKVIMQAKND